MTTQLTRRAFLASTAVLAPATASARYISSRDGFDYEVTRTDAEWREMLGEETYKIMREGHTEPQRSNPHWDSLAAGTYTCKGCDLMVYDARWKVVVDKGWLFFRHGEPNALLLGIDWPAGSGMADEFAHLAAVEAHCRRCGSHMGHIVYIENKLLHCINGAGLNFTSA